MSVQYYDLLDTDCPSIPPGMQLPLVLVNGDTLSNRGKISVPLIRKQCRGTERQSIKFELYLKNRAAVPWMIARPSEFKYRT